MTSQTPKRTSSDSIDGDAPVPATRLPMAA